MKRPIGPLPRALFALAAAVLLAGLAGEFGALLLDTRRARLAGAGLALCVGAALATLRPRRLKPAGLAAGLIASAARLAPLRLGRLAARRGVAGYHAALGLLLACAAVAMGGALACLPRPGRLSRAASARRKNRAKGRSSP